MSNEDQSSALWQPDQSGAEDARRFGLMVRARRKAQGLRQEDVASATGVPITSPCQAPLMRGSSMPLRRRLPSQI